MYGRQTTFRSPSFGLTSTGRAHIILCSEQGWWYPLCGRGSLVLTDFPLRSTGRKLCFYCMKKAQRTSLLDLLRDSGRV
jgi:hypothetical protein